LARAKGARHVICPMGCARTGMDSPKRRMNARNDGRLGDLTRRRYALAETSSRPLIPFCLVGCKGYEIEERQPKGRQPKGLRRGVLLPRLMLVAGHVRPRT